MDLKIVNDLKIGQHVEGKIENNFRGVHIH